MLKRKFGGSRALSKSLNFVTKPAFRRRGFAENRIITDWGSIVGDMLGDISAPRRLIFAKKERNNGVLHVEVYDSGMAMELIYLEPVVIEKIAAYFGYKAVGRLKIIQKPLSQKQLRKKEVDYLENPKVSEEVQSRLNILLEEIEDDELRKTLHNLGVSVVREG